MPILGGTSASSSVTLAERGAWATATAYSVGDVVTQSSIRYVCKTGHTSGTFSTDLGASKWTALDPGAAVPLATSGQTPAQEPVVSAVSGASVGSLAFAARADHVHASAGLFLLYGDGSDGAVSLDGTSTSSLFSKSGSTYTASGAIIYATDVTIASGVTVVLDGAVLLVQGTLTNNGTIRTRPLDATGASNGAQTTSQYFVPIGRTAPAGGTGVGTTGGAAGQTAYLGGGGSAGGTGTSGAGGAATGAPTFPLGNALRVLRSPMVAISGGFFPWVDKLESTSFANPYIARGGLAGGSGAGDGTNSGGAGGGGGNWLVVRARVLAGSGTFTAAGGAGGNAAAGNCGGGGGGGGGVVLVHTTDNSSWTGTLTAPGGAGGTGTGTGTAGTAGSAGNTLLTVWK